MLDQFLYIDIDIYILYMSIRIRVGVNVYHGAVWYVYVWGGVVFYVQCLCKDVVEPAPHHTVERWLRCGSLSEPELVLANRGRSEPPRPTVELKRAGKRARRTVS